ncbi:hypothetical protein KC640_03200 [Candidatus Dojkabacteria bacterium]|uniref:Uncharacterized protein n=1 Tax=Candidatus Dojkabacteria bacterium TaxID=2099670 RepID=A0A955L0G9_9BACT|nr:hypothetical protein [Candidatus Dojkabacteria bacterium]
MSIGTILYLDQVLPDYGEVEELARGIHQDAGEVLAAMQNKLGGLWEVPDEGNLEHLLSGLQSAHKAAVAELENLSDSQVGIGLWLWLENHRVELHDYWSAARFAADFDPETALQTLEIPRSLRPCLTSLTHKLAVADEQLTYDQVLLELKSNLTGPTGALRQLLADELAWSALYLENRAAGELDSVPQLVREWQHRQLEFVRSTLGSIAGAEIVWRHFLRLKYLFQDLSLIAISLVSGANLNIADLINYE